jgi:hypothetical protein
MALFWPVRNTDCRTLKAIAHVLNLWTNLSDKRTLAFEAQEVRGQRVFFGKGVLRILYAVVGIGWGLDCSCTKAQSGGGVPPPPQIKTKGPVPRPHPSSEYSNFCQKPQGPLPPKYPLTACKSMPLDQIPSVAFMKGKSPMNGFSLPMRTSR